ncbi:MAG: hypothetical protein U9R74_09275 [Pseudomonadota bacterium]|nr:hypothetical protein [Pseudomonadota bacterium]
MTGNRSIGWHIATLALATLLLGASSCKLWLTRDADPRTGEGTRLEQDQAECRERSRGADATAFESCMAELGWSEAKIRSANSDAEPAAPVTASEGPVEPAEPGTSTDTLPAVAPATAVAAPRSEPAPSPPDPSASSADKTAPESGSSGWWKLGGTPDDLKRDRAACGDTSAPGTVDCLKAKGWKLL